MIIFLTEGYLKHFIHNNVVIHVVSKKNVVIHVDTSMKTVELSIDVAYNISHY